MAGNPKDRDGQNAEVAQGDELPAPLPRPGAERQEEKDQQRERSDPEFLAIRDQLGRLIRQEVRQEITIVREEIRELHIGPLPHPSTLERYNQIVPGSAKMIFDNFEEQGRHRRELEKYALHWGTIRSFAGVVCGLIVTLCFLFVSYSLIKNGHGWEGTVLGTFDIVGLVTVFVYGTHVVRDERVRKARIMSGKDEQAKDS